MAASPTSALDIGCEGGRWAQILSSFGWNIICTDIDKKALDICQKRLPAAKCIQVNPDEKVLPCETASLGLILCIEVHPVMESEWFLSEAHRALSAAGLIVGVTLNRHSLRGLFVTVRQQQVSKMQGYRHYTQSYRKRREELHNNGFQVVYERGLCWPPFGRASNSFLIPLFTFLERNLWLSRVVRLSPRIVFIAKKGDVSAKLAVRE